MLSKSRWVKHNQIILVLILSHELECLLSKRFVWRIISKIVCHIATHQVNCLLAHIYRVHQFCSATQGIDRETARIAEHIEHLLTLGIMLQQSTVVTLVDEEASFLTAEPINTEVQSILFCPKISVEIGSFCTNQVTHTLPLNRCFMRQSII